MPSSELKQQIAAMPKLEMHIHLEGTISQSRVKAMAEALGEELPRPEDELFETGDLSLFLATLDWVCSLVRTPEIAAQIAADFVEYCKEQNIVYTEVIVNPTHWKGMHFSELFPALDECFEKAAAEGGPDIRLLPSILRQQTREEALELVVWIGAAQKHGKGKRIVGLSIDGNEAASGPTGEKFAPAYKLAAELGLGLTAHAGESSGADGVTEALDYLGAQRLDHGIRAAEKPEVVQRLVDSGTTLNICLSSNCTLLYKDISEHPIFALMEAGVPFTLNTDDPVVLKTNLIDELSWAADKLDLDVPMLLSLQQNAVNSAFCSESRKAELNGILSAYLN